MPKTLGLDVVIGASVGTAIKSIELVTNSTKVLGATIDKLHSKKLTILEGIDKEFKAKFEPIESELEKFYNKQKDIKLKLKVKDEELKELNKKIKNTEKEIKKLEKEKLDLEKEFKKGKISAEEFEFKTKEIERELTKLQKKKLGLESKLEITSKKATLLNNSLSHINKTIEKLKNKKLKLKDELEAAKEEAIKTNKELKKIGKVIESINKRKIKIQTNIEKRENLKKKFWDTLAIGTTIAAPFKAGIEFESEMARVKALSGANKEEFKKLEETAKKLGSTTIFSASEAAKGMQFLAMAGYKTNDIIKAMPGLLDLAAAGQTDLATTADITSNILSGFGLSADKTAHVADVLAKAMTSANVDIRMLGETMKYVAPATSSLGASLEEVTALTAQLGNVGIQGSEAGTALRAMYARLASPPSEAKKSIQMLGLQLKDTNGNFIGMFKILEQLQQKTKYLSDTQKMTVLKNLFGMEAMSAASALLKLPIEKLKEYEKALQNADGTAKKIAKTQTDTVKGSFKALGSAIEGLSISLSALFLPVIKTATDSITWFTQKLNNFVEKHKTLATILGGVVAGFGVLTVASFALGYAATFVANAYHKSIVAVRLLQSAFILLINEEKRAVFWTNVLNKKAKVLTFTKKTWAITIGLVSKSLNILVGALKFVGRSMLWLGRVFLLNPIGLVITAIAAGAYLIYNNWDKLKSWFGGFWESLKDSFSQGVSVITNIFLYPINTIQAMWNKLIGWISKKLELISSIGGKIKSFLGFGDEEDKLTLKPVTEKVKPIVTAAVTTTIATAQPATLKPLQMQTIKPVNVPVNTQQVQRNAQTITPQTIVYNFNFGDIKVETKDGKIVNPEELKEQLKQIIEDINFEHKQRSLSDVV